MVRRGISLLDRRDIYHQILDLRWWKLLAVSLALYWAIVLVFAGLYYASNGVDGGMGHWGARDAHWC
jgi:hypothetical protein